VSLPDSPGAYNDCYDLYQRAIDTPGGVRTLLSTKNEAYFFQLRMHKFRTIQRRNSRRTYPTDHPLYDTSEFDPLQVTIREDTEGGWWVYVKPHGAKLTIIEPIEEPSDG